MKLYDIMRKSRTNAGWLGILGLGLLLRLPQLGKSALFQDEIGFIHIATPQMPFLALVASFWQQIISNGQMPVSFSFWNLYFKTMGLFFDNVTANAWVGRFPAVVFGMLGLFYVIRLARRLFNVNVAAMGSLLFMGLAFPVYYSRELYCYPVILFLAPYATWRLFGLLFDEHHVKQNFTGVLLAFTLMVYTHMGGLLWLVAVSLTTFLFWIHALLVERQPIQARRFFTAGMALGGAFLLTSPFIARFLLDNTAHTAGSPYSVPLILNDAVCKLFMGEHLVFAILAWSLLVAGLLGLLCRVERRKDHLFLVLSVPVGMLLLAWATHKSQYLSVRYFTPVAPFLIMIFGVGISSVSAWLSAIVKRPSEVLISRLLVGGILVYAFTMNLIPIYQLNYKEPMQFRGVAQWLNTNLPDGTPYVWFSGYILRWVPGYYATPGLVAACPFVHGSAPGDVARLTERQKHFARRFPVSAYIGIPHDYTDATEGTLPWPRQYFRRHAEVSDTSLAILISRGIYFGTPYYKLKREDSVTDIFYNTPEDAVLIQRERGEPIYADFPGWRCEPIAGHPQGLWVEYAWLHTAARQPELRLYNLKDKVLQGTLSLQVAVLGPQDTEFNIFAMDGNESKARATMHSGSFHNLPIALRLEPNERKILKLLIPPVAGRNPSAMAVHDYRFDVSTSD